MNESQKKKNIEELMRAYLAKLAKMEEKLFSYKKKVILKKEQEDLAKAQEKINNL